MAVLVNPANPTTESTVRDAEAARAMGLQVQVLNASTSREIDAAFATLVRDRAEALFVAGDGFFRAGGSNLPRSRCAMGFPRHIQPRVFRSRRADELW